MKSFLIIVILCNTIFPFNDGKSSPFKAKDNSVYYQIDYDKLKDTLFTLSDYFVEVNLSTQMAYLHSRYDSVKSFGISSGTARIKDGIETNEGIYAIQFKVEKWHSIQFDSTLMLDFITFNWGIGFHALAGNSYYKYLGVKKSSHGCVRVSREMGRELYRKLKYGTPVILHKGNPAVFIGFADKSDTDLVYTEYSELKNLLTRRINNLYKGEYFLSPNEKLIIDNKNVTHAGLPVGDGRKIRRRQLLKPDYLFTDVVMPDVKPMHNESTNLLSSVQLNYFSGNVPHLSSFLEDVFD
jgi:hypothetical protein